jgi:hypothetical protein
MPDEYTAVRKIRDGKDALFVTLPISSGEMQWAV